MGKKAALEYQRGENLERAEGFTILELVVVLSVLVVLLGGVVTLATRVQIAFAEQLQVHVAEQIGMRVTERLSEELMQAHPETLYPLNTQGSETLEFQKVLGYEGNNILLGPVVTVDLRPGKGESANGKDDDGDGRIDEGFVTYTEEGETPIRLAGEVMNLHFLRTTGGIQFSFDVLFLDREGLPRWTGFSQEVALRN